MVNGQLEDGYVKRCFGTMEYRKTSPLCRQCEVFEECAVVNPKKLRLK